MITSLHEYAYAFAVSLISLVSDYTPLLNIVSIDEPLISMLKEAFDIVKNQMGPCGITCATCDLGNGTVAEAALNLQNYLNTYGVASWGDQVPGWSDIDFDHFDQYLGWAQKYTRCLGCEQGGGPPDCAIRSCSRQKEYELCSQCSELEECKKFEWLGDYSQILKRTLTENKGKSKKEIISNVIG